MKVSVTQDATDYFYEPDQQSTSMSYLPERHPNLDKWNQRLGWIFSTSAMHQKMASHVQWDVILNKNVLSIKIQDIPTSASSHSTPNLGEGISLRLILNCILYSKLQLLT